MKEKGKCVRSKKSLSLPNNQWISAFVYVHDLKLPASRDLVCVGVWFSLDGEGHVRCRRTAHCNTPPPCSIFVSPPLSFFCPSISLCITTFCPNKKMMTEYVILSLRGGRCRYEQKAFAEHELVESDTSIQLSLQWCQTFAPWRESKRSECVFYEIADGWPSSIFILTEWDCRGTSWFDSDSEGYDVMIKGWTFFYLNIAWT